MMLPSRPFLSAVLQLDIDHNTTLCLACSSSLPPLKKTSATPEIFITRCCQRPICLSCTTANPRLKRYDPCLACLGGVGIVRSGSGTPLGAQQEANHSINVDGAVREEDTFILGEEGDDDDETLAGEEGSGSLPCLSSVGESTDPRTADSSPGLSPTSVEQNPIINEPAPFKYYICRSDTLQGIALRFGLDGRELCRLNNLPPSALSTTPHILHTRQFLTFPPSVRKLQGLSSNETGDEQKERAARRGKERAEKRLQMLTKEVDWRVAKAYVALADDPTDAEVEEYDWKRKEAGFVGAPGSSNLEQRAIGRYLDDEEWEERARAQGSTLGVSRFPFVRDWSEKSLDRSEDGVRRWWQWRSSGS